MYTKSINKLSIKIYYAFYMDDIPDTPVPCHDFVTNKDLISCDALFVTSFETNNPSKLVSMLREYSSNKPNECIYIAINRHEEVLGNMGD